MTSKTEEVGYSTTQSADETSKSRSLQHSSNVSESDETGIISEKNPFNDQAVALHWGAVYEESNYECRHVFDPTLTWTEQEEKRLVRKLDWRVCLWAVSVDQAESIPSEEP